eukprot:10228-Heterococcus_DN1.PRE.6
MEMDSSDLAAHTCNLTAHADAVVTLSTSSSGSGGNVVPVHRTAVQLPVLPVVAFNLLAVTWLRTQQHAAAGTAYYSSNKTRGANGQMLSATEQHCTMHPCSNLCSPPADLDAAGRIAKQQKLASADISSNPLSEAGVLQRALGYVGPGCWLLMSLVSKAWRESYLHVLQQQIKTEHDCVETGIEGEPRMTLLKVAVTSASVLELACDSFERGMLRSSYVCKGAARRGCLAELKWLVIEQKCPVHSDISAPAAANGSVPVLDFLKQCGISFTVDTAYSAAAAGHQHIIEYLQAKGCSFDNSLYLAAAGFNHVHVLQRLRELECPWDMEALCKLAAEQGLLPVLQWAKQQGATFTEDSMLQAAACGHTAVCAYLLAQRCPCSADACTAAVSNRQLDTLRWLLRNSPYDADVLWGIAAARGHISGLVFLQHVGVNASPDALSKALFLAGSQGHLAVAQWLRAQGAEWPPRLSALIGGGLQQWEGAVLEWARAEGCTSPLE